MNIGDSGVLSSIARLARELNFPTIRVESSSGAAIRLLSTEDAYLYAIRTFAIQDLVELYVALDRLKASRVESNTAAKGAKGMNIGDVSTTQLIADIWELAVELDFPVSSFVRESGVKTGLISDKSAYLYAIRTFPTEDLQRLLAALHHVKEPTPEPAPPPSTVDVVIAGGGFEALPTITQLNLTLCIRQLVEVAKFLERRRCSILTCGATAEYVGTPRFAVPLCREHYSGPERSRGDA